MTEYATLEELSAALREFVRELEWERFHSPKNLSMALVVEAAELAEHFQWLEGGESANLDAETRREVSHELADVLAYLVRLADRLDVDLLEAVSDKMRINAEKYPADRVRGSARKYNRY